MTKLTKRINRETVETYRHYKRTIIISLFADTISLRLKGTRKSYDIPVANLMDDLCRREVWRLQDQRSRRRIKSRLIVPRSRIKLPGEPGPKNLVKLFRF